MAGSTGVHDTVVNQLLSKIDGVEQLNNILVIGTVQCGVGGGDPFMAGFGCPSVKATVQRDVHLVAVLFLDIGLNPQMSVLYSLYLRYDQSARPD